MRTHHGLPLIHSGGQLPTQRWRQPPEAVGPHLHRQCRLRGHLDYIGEDRINLQVIQASRTAPVSEDDFFEKNQLRKGFDLTRAKGATRLTDKLDRVIVATGLLYGGMPPCRRLQRVDSPRCVLVSACAS